MNTAFSLSQFIFGVYIPFVIALVGLSVPLVTVLLSVFAQGRNEIIRVYEEQLVQLASDIAAKKSSGHFLVLQLMWEMFRKQFFLTLLNPNFYLFSLLIPPILAIGASLLALVQNPYFYMSGSVLLLLLFFMFLWSFIKIIADITSSRDSKREEREGNVIEALQTLIKNSDPNAARVRDVKITLDGHSLSDGDLLPSVTLGKEFSWRFSLNNSDKQSIKKAELGIQFPVDVFEVKSQRGYEVYVPENITRYRVEYIQTLTNKMLVPHLVVTPHRTGTYAVTAWIKGENVETKYFTLKIVVEMEA